MTRRSVFAPSRLAPQMARATARSFSAAWNFTEERATSLVAVVSSLVTDALENDRSATVGLDLEVRDGAVHGTVRDGTDWDPHRPSGGHPGTQIADALADEVETRSDADGTSVSFELREPWTAPDPAA